jgi:hypothetical protein
MTDDNHIPHESIDMGEPIHELSSLRETPPKGFKRRIQNSIQRRMFASQVVDLSLVGFFETFFGYFEMIVETVGGRGRPKE